MNSTKSNAFNAAIAATAAAVCLVGCTNPRVGIGVKPETERIPGQEESVVTKADASLIKIAVATTPVGDDAAGLAAKVGHAAETALVSGGFTVSTGEPDVRVDMSVTSSQFDKFGDYYVIEGAVPSAKVTVPIKAGKVVAQTAFPTVRGERVLGKDKAIDSVAARLVPEISSWIGANVTPKAIGLAAQTIVVQRRTLFYKSEDPLFVKKFVEAVNSLNGVLECRYVSGEPTERLYEFRVVYDADGFPEGLVTHIIAACKKLDIEVAR